MRSASLFLLLAMLAPAADRGQPPLVPLVFVHGEDEATTRKVIREVAEGGNTGFVWESRPHPGLPRPEMVERSRHRHRRSEEAQPRSLAVR